MTDENKKKVNEGNSFKEELERLPEEFQKKLKSREKYFLEISKVIEEVALEHSIGFYITPEVKIVNNQPQPNFDKLIFNFLLDDFERPIPEFNLKVLLQDKFDKYFKEVKLRDNDGDEVVHYLFKEDENIRFEGTSIALLRENCFDASYEDLQRLGSSLIYKDNRGFIGALKSIEIHRSLLLQKFEKYVVAYVGAGSWLRGEKSNDFDVFIIVDDTDVKRMPRLQVRDQLMKIAWQMAQEVGQLTGITLHCQVYLLTDFWDALKDAHPVMFTFLRDGVPFYDRGIFSAWKELLKLGKIRPSAVAIDMHMGVGTQLIDRAKGMFGEIFMNDIYYSVLNPAQALLMLKGYNPTTPKETVKMFKEVLLAKEKCITEKEATILEEVVKTFKRLEHNDDKSFMLKGADIDKHLKSNEILLKKIKKLFESITEEKNKESIGNSYNDLLTHMRSIEGFSDLSEEVVLKKFEAEIIKKNKVSAFVKKTLKSILKAVKDFEAGKLNVTEIYKIQKEINLVSGEIKDYVHKSMASEFGKRRLNFSYDNGKAAEIICYDGFNYLICVDDNKGFKFTDKKIEEFDLGKNHFTDDSKYDTVKLSGKLFDNLKKVLNIEEIML